MNLIKRFHKEVGVLAEGDVWNIDLPEVHWTKEDERRQIKMDEDIKELLRNIKTSLEQIRDGQCKILNGEFKLPIKPNKVEDKEQLGKASDIKDKETLKGKGQTVEDIKECGICELHPCDRVDNVGCEEFRGG